MEDDMIEIEITNTTITDCMNNPSRYFIEVTTEAKETLRKRNGHLKGNFNHYFVTRMLPNGDGVTWFGAIQLTGEDPFITVMKSRQVKGLRYANQKKKT